MRVSQSGGIAPAHGTAAYVHPLHRPLPQSAIETATIAPVRVSLFHRLVRLKRSLPILKRPKGAVIGTAPISARAENAEVTETQYAPKVMPFGRKFVAVR